MEAYLSDGTKIYYEIYGVKNNKTLIFLHGNMEDSSLFLNQIEEFKEKYQVLVIDSRGHGKSAWGNLEEYSIKKIVKDLGELIDSLKIVNYYIIGFSDGANIGMEFAISQPSELEGLVLVGGNLRPMGMKLSVVLDIVKEYILTFRRAEGLLARKKLGLMLFEPKIKFNDLRLIQVPTLVIAGEYDLIKKSETLRIGSLINSSKITIVKDANHFFIYNNSNIFNKMLEQWLNSV